MNIDDFIKAQINYNDVMAGEKIGPNKLSVGFNYERDTSPARTKTVFDFYSKLADYMESKNYHYQIELFYQNARGDLVDYDTGIIGGSNIPLEIFHEMIALLRQDFKVRTGPWNAKIKLSPIKDGFEDNSKIYNDFVNYLNNQGANIPSKQKVTEKE